MATKVPMRFRYCCKSLSTAVAALHQSSDFSTQSVSAIFCSACDSAPLSLAPSLRRSLAPSPWGARCGGLWQRPGVRARAAVRGQLPAGPGEASLGVVAGVECLVWWTFGGRGWGIQLIWPGPDLARYQLAVSACCFLVFYSIANSRTTGTQTAQTATPVATLHPFLR